jgi:hypothetical protein
MVLVPEERFQRRIDVNLICLEIPVPNTHTPRRRGARIPLLAVAQCGLGAPAFGEIPDDDQHLVLSARYDSSFVMLEALRSVHGIFNNRGRLFLRPSGETIFANRGHLGCENLAHGSTHESCGLQRFWRLRGRVTVDTHAVTAQE